MKQSNLLPLKGFLTFLILHELSQKSLAGDDLSRKIGRRKGAMLTPGTIYPALKRLRRLKLVQYSKDGRKKYYLLTEKGDVELTSLYKLFSNYFYGLKGKIKRKHYQAEFDE